MLFFVTVVTVIHPAVYLALVYPAVSSLEYLEYLEHPAVSRIFYSIQSILQYLELQKMLVVVVALLQVARTLQDTASCTASVETDPGLVQALPCVFPFNFQERFNTITLPERLARRG